MPTVYMETAEIEQLAFKEWLIIHAPNFIMDTWI